MNGKTENPQGRNDLSTPVRFWLIVLTVATLALVFFTKSEPEVYPNSRDSGFHLTLMPWVDATRITLSHGLNLFSGDPVSPPSDAQRTSMLVGLLLSLVAGPTLFLLGLRSYLARSDTQKSSYGPVFALMVGGVITYSVAISSIPVAVTQWISTASIREAQTLGDQRDKLIGSIAFLARQAREYRILPSSQGGGNGLFTGFTIPAELQKTGSGTYSIESDQDTLLVLRGTPIVSEGQSVVGTVDRSGTLRFRFEDVSQRKENK